MFRAVELCHKYKQIQTTKVSPQDRKERGQKIMLGKQTRIRPPRVIWALLKVIIGRRLQRRILSRE